MKYVNIDEAYENLGNAIIERAADDYRAALKGLVHDPENEEHQRDVKDLEKFFRSSWYETLTNVDGTYLIRMLRKEVNG